MSANRFYRLFLLLFAVIHGGACGTGSARLQRESTASNNPRNVGGQVPSNSGSASSSSKDYNSPDNAFALKIPSGWKLDREEADGAYMTVIRPAQSRAANLSIMTVTGGAAKTASAELNSRMLVEGSKPFFQGWISGLKEQARVEGTGDIYPTRFADLDALRMDVTYYRDDAEDPRQGYSVFLIGDKTTFFISLTGSQSRFRELEEIISTIRIEP
ncbi:MAG: hypothetical protein LC803_09805 [Acidobacteria bacterium]|nr:hypothetical protein [Acidobacteriota bacterium]